MYNMEQVATLARSWADTDDPVVRQRLADLHTRFEILRFLGYRVRTAAARGEMPGPESSVMKLAVSALYETGGDLVVALQGAAGMLTHQDAPYGGRFQDLFMSQWAPRIGGGTDQIQRNIIGERVLGLPGEVRNDKDVLVRSPGGVPRALGDGRAGPPRRRFVAALARLGLDRRRRRRRPARRARRRGARARVRVRGER